MKRLWVPIIRCFDEAMDEYVFRPDVPRKGMRWKMDKRACPVDLIPTSPNHGKPLVGCAPILVENKYAAKITTAIDERDVPERDRLTVRMMQEASYDWEKDADGFFDSIPNVAGANVERKLMVKDILLQGVARGLSPERAEAVCKRLNLPLARDA